MADSGLIHPLVINAELGIDAYPTVFGPDVDHPDAVVASKAYDSATGDWYTKKSSGWSIDAAADDVYTKGASDARYVAKAGDTMTGALAVALATSGTAFNIYKSGDSYSRWSSDENGGQSWGSGAAAPDTNLYRYTVGRLRTDQNFEAAGSIRSESAAWMMGTSSGFARIMYGQSASEAFSLLTNANGYADLYARVLYPLAIAGPGSNSSFVLARNAANTAFVDLLYMDSGDNAVIPRTLNTHQINAGDIYTSRSTTTGVLFLGSDGTSYIYRDSATNFTFVVNSATALSLTATLATFADNLVTGGRATAGGAINAGGQLRATGWWVSGDSQGIGAELGVSGGEANLIGYNRTTSAYIPLALAGSVIRLEANTQFSDHAAFLYGGSELAYIGAAQSTNALITGSAAGDLCLRSVSQKILFSVDNGVSPIMQLESTQQLLGGFQIATIIEGSTPPTSLTPGLPGSTLAVTF